MKADVEAIKQEFLNTKRILNREIAFEYLNKEAIFDVIYERIRSHVEWWLENINTNQINNLKQSPQLVFIHCIAHKMFPQDYGETVGVLMVNEERLAELGMTIEEMLPEETDFEDAYGDVVIDVVGGYDIDAEVSDAIDTAELIKAYSNSAICDHERIAGEWQDIFVQEYGLACDLVFAAVSSWASKHTARLSQL